MSERGRGSDAHGGLMKDHRRPPRDDGTDDGGARWTEQVVAWHQKQQQNTNSKTQPLQTRRDEDTPRRCRLARLQVGRAHRRVEDRKPVLVAAVERGRVLVLDELVFARSFARGQKARGQEAHTVSRKTHQVPAPEKEEEQTTDQSAAAVARSTAGRRRLCVLSLVVILVRREALPLPSATEPTRRAPPSDLILTWNQGGTGSPPPPRCVFALRHRS